MKQIIPELSYMCFPKLTRTTRWGLTSSCPWFWGSLSPIPGVLKGLPAMCLCCAKDHQIGQDWQIQQDSGGDLISNELQVFYWTLSTQLCLLLLCFLIVSSWHVLQMKCPASSEQFGGFFCSCRTRSLVLLHFGIHHKRTRLQPTASAVTLKIPRFLSPSH